MKCVRMIQAAVLVFLVAVERLDLGAARNGQVPAAVHNRHRGDDEGRGAVGLPGHASGRQDAGAFT